MKTKWSPMWTKRDLINGRVIKFQNKMKQQVIGQYDQETKLFSVAFKFVRRRKLMLEKPKTYKTFESFKKSLFFLTDLCEMKFKS